MLISTPEYRLLAAQVRKSEMSFRLGSTSILLTAALIAGCAQQSSAPPVASAVTAAAPPAAMATATGSFDGSYGNRDGSSGTRCGTTRFGFPLIVKNGQASLRTVSYGTLEGPVAPDGGVQIRSTGAALTGKITGNKFAGDLTMGARAGTCVFPLDYTKYQPRAS